MLDEIRSRLRAATLADEKQALDRLVEMAAVSAEDRICDFCRGSSAGAQSAWVV